MTAAYFIAKFEAIPEEMWCVGLLHDDQGRSCAFGHCGVGYRFEWTKESIALSQLLAGPDDRGSVPEINNGDDPRYQQPTPKQRILAALRDGNT